MSTKSVFTDIPAGEYLFEGRAILVRNPVRIGQPVRASDIVIDGVTPAPFDLIPPVMVNFLKAKAWANAA